MPTINGRYVPENHASAAAETAVAEVMRDVSAVEPAPKKKTATRTRRGRKAETTMLEEGDEKR